jgi:hypothetical protein
MSAEVLSAISAEIRAYLVAEGVANPSFHATAITSGAVAPLLTQARRDAAQLGRRAALDPGAFVKRGPDCDGEPFGERLDQWQARATDAALLAADLP